MIHIRLIAACLISAVTVGCGGATDLGPPGVPVVGNWSYIGQQVSPGTASLQDRCRSASRRRTGLGTIDFVDGCARGQQRRLAGPFAGRTVDSTTGFRGRVGSGESAPRRTGKGRLAYRDVGRDVVDRTADSQRNVSLRASPVTARGANLRGAANDLVPRDRQGNAITLYVRTAATCAAVGMKPPPPFPVNLSALYIELRVWEGVAAVPVAMV